MDNFFNLFRFDNFEDCANDALYIYEVCSILRDVDLPSGHKLVKGDKYDAVWFYFSSGEFEFVKKWVPEKPGSNNHIAGPGSFTVTTQELSPYMVWWDEDLPKANKIVEAINNHKCKHCGNERCSKDEKSCWKCGETLC